MARDPFSWADDFARTQHSRAAQESSQAQNTLMNVFAQEARRQAPWSDLPVDLAKQQNQYDLAYRNSTALVDYKAANKPAPAPAKIANAIRGAAKAYGEDSDFYLTLADVESSFNPNARNASGAGGLMQIMPGTAKELGINPFDIQQSIDGSIRYNRQNRQYLEKNGIKATPGAMYLAWQQGAGGAAKLLANPNVPAEQIVGRAAVIQNGGRPGMSAGQFANMWISKFERKYKARQAMRQKDNPLVRYDMGDGTSLDLAGLDQSVQGGDTGDDEEFM